MYNVISFYLTVFLPFSVRLRLSLCRGGLLPSVFMLVEGFSEMSSVFADELCVLLSTWVVVTGVFQMC